ncbi:hypothetical protein WA158_004042 [Blastocystis sp. Blastoise]
MFPVDNKDTKDGIKSLGVNPPSLSNIKFQTFPSIKRQSIQNRFGQFNTSDLSSIELPNDKDSKRMKMESEEKNLEISIKEKNHDTSDLQAHTEEHSEESAYLSEIQDSQSKIHSEKEETSFNGDLEINMNNSLSEYKERHKLIQEKLESLLGKVQEDVESVFSCFLSDIQTHIEQNSTLFQNKIERLSEQLKQQDNYEIKLMNTEEALNHFMESIQNK